MKAEKYRLEQHTDQTRLKEKEEEVGENKKRKELMRAENRNITLS